MYKDIYTVFIGVYRALFCPKNHTRFPAPSLNTAPTYTERSTLVYCRQCSATRADVLYVQDVSAEGAETARLYPSVLRSVYVGTVFKTRRGYRRIPRTHDFALIFRAKKCAVYAEKYGISSCPNFTVDPYLSCHILLLCSERPLLLSLNGWL